MSESVLAQCAMLGWLLLIGRWTCHSHIEQCSCQNIVWWRGPRTGNFPLCPPIPARFGSAWHINTPLQALLGPSLRSCRRCHFRRQHSCEGRHLPAAGWRAIDLPKSDGQGAAALPGRGGAAGEDGVACGGDAAEAAVDKTVGYGGGAGAQRACCGFDQLSRHDAMTATSRE
jgi:hypothetical protein